MEFKKLSDVEVVEAVSDNANVLIEENGVIKKAPKNQVGGAPIGSGIDTYMIVFYGMSDNPVFVSEGLFERIVYMFEQKIPINLAIYEYQTYDDGIFLYESYVPCAIDYISKTPDGYEVFCKNNEYQIYVYSDHVYVNYIG